MNGVSAFSTTSSTWRQMNRSVVGQQRAGQQARLAQDLEAVADAEHRAAVGGELGDRLHHRREAGDRAGAQVVAVGEAAGHDDRVDAREVAVAVPEQPCLADRARTALERVALVAGARERTTPIHGCSPLRRPPRRSRSPRSAGWRAAARTSASSCARVVDLQLDQPADVHVVRRPRSRAPAARARPPGPAGRGCPPSAGSARGPSLSSGRLPASSSNGSAGDPLVGLDVLGARVLRPPRRAAPAPGGVWSQPTRVEPVAHVLLVEGGLRRGRARSSSAGQKREESGVSTSSPSTISPPRRAAELELGVGEDDPALRARGRRRARRARARSGAAPPSAARSPTISAARSKSMFSSCSPISALVAGVKIGSGSRSDSCRPGGQLDAADRAGLAGTPSSPSRTGSRARRTRPGTSRASDHACARPRDLRRARPSEMRWLGTISPVCSNQNTRHPVSTLPLSGIGGREDDVVGGDPVGGDHEQLVAVLVHLPDLARAVELRSRARSSAADLRLVGDGLAHRSRRADDGLALVRGEPEIDCRSAPDSCDRSRCPRSRHQAIAGARELVLVAGLVERLAPAAGVAMSRRLLTHV